MFKFLKEFQFILVWSCLLFSCIFFTSTPAFAEGAIIVFKASKEFVSKGDTVTISWTTSGAAKRRLSGAYLSTQWVEESWDNETAIKNTTSYQYEIECFDESDTVTEERSNQISILNKP